MSRTRRHTRRILDHPLAADALVVLRDPTTGSVEFRAAAGRVATLLAVEAALALPLRAVAAPTPLAVAAGERVEAWPLLVPVLRAGLGFLDAVHAVVPAASVALVGMRRDEKTLRAERYCDTVPAGLAGAPVWILEPMLATGATLAATCTILAERGAGPMTALCLLAAPDGLSQLAAAHPGVSVICAAVDERLDSSGFIVPGLGDAGDRLFGPNASSS